jgi:L-ascorbate metabolism protein UlaG (beta-lactamase superfamily)
MITVRWFGHSMWEISDDTVSVITDPFCEMGYPMPRGLTADIVLSSHGHSDHNNCGLVSGNPLVFREAGIFEHRGVCLDLRSVAHDEEGGTKRGRTLLMKIGIGGRTFLHCGDLGYVPEDEIIDWIGHIDGLFIPVGGYYTVDAGQAWELVRRIDPTITFPQHYKTRYIRSPIQTAEEFLKLAGERNPERVGGDTVRLTDTDFDRPRVIVFRQFE